MPRKRTAELPLIWDPPPSKKWSDTEGREMYDAFKRVGLSVPEFARRTGLGRMRVWAWVKKYGAAEPSGFRVLQFPKGTPKESPSKAPAIQRAAQPAQRVGLPKGERKDSTSRPSSNLEIVVSNDSYVIRVLDGANEAMALRLARALVTPGGQ